VERQLRDIAETVSMLLFGLQTGAFGPCLADICSTLVPLLEMGERRMTGVQRRAGRPSPAREQMPQPSTVVETLALLSSAGGRGRVHATEWRDQGQAEPQALADAFSPGDAVRAAVLGVVDTAEGRRHGLRELSMRASVLEAAAAGQGKRRAKAEPALAIADLKPGQAVLG
jgi:hypothetical protein